MKRKRLESEPIISRGIYLTPAEIRAKADFYKNEFICRFGRIQGLKIAKIIHEELKRVQDKPTKAEGELIAEERKKRVGSITDQIKTIQNKLRKMEGK